MKLDTALIVMGMHRSGTSALTRVLSLHGFGLPETLIPPGEANERGFWESAAINALNNRILDALGQSWFSFDPVDSAWTGTDAARRLHASMVDVLEAEFRDAQNIVLKDPRICRVADFWMDALAQMAQRTATVFIIRNPIEVAGSLISRNEFDPQLGKLLWLRYYLDAEAKTRGVTRCFVNYDDLLDDWRAVLARVRDELSLDLGGEFNPEVDTFLASDLRHHSVSHASVITQISDFPWLSRAYKILHAWGQGRQPSEADTKALDEIRLALDEAVPAFLSIVVNARLDQKRLATLRQLSEEREKGAKAEIHATLNRVVEMTREAAVQRATLETKLSEATQRAKEREGVIKHLRGDLNRSSGRVAVLASDLKVANLELSRARDRIRSMERTLAWRTRQSVRGLAKLVRFQGFRKGYGQQKRLHASADLIRASALFDAAWYLEQYPDVGLAKVEPAAHYIDNGWREGRDPGPHFSTSGYLRANPDVAAADINPLLHFLEHGQSEGRNVSVDVPAVARKSDQDFGPAHPCPHFDIAVPRPVRWIRAASLAGSDANGFRIGNITAGYHSDHGHNRDAMNHIADLFNFLSGDVGPEFPSTVREGIQLTAGTTHKLIDAWFTTDFSIRARLSCDGDGFVLRAFQRKPGEDRQSVLVGEGLITGQLDTVDYSLLNPFSPLLIVECSPEGALRGATLLPFPSLCRGGAHYGELLSLADDLGQQPIDLIELSSPLAANLSALRTGHAPLVSAVRVDLRGGDGTELIFRPEFQTWLRDILFLPILPGEIDEGRDQNAVAYLKRALGEGAVQMRNEGAFQLEIRSDEIPTLQIITALKVLKDQTSEERARVMAAPFIVTKPNPAMPKFGVTLPSDAASLIGMASKYFRNAAPILVPTNAAPPCESSDLVAAIRFVGGRSVQDAELLMPAGMNAAHVLLPAVAKPVIAVINTGGWEQSNLVTAIEALGRQGGANRLALVLVTAGIDPADHIIGVCNRFFPSRWSLMTSLAEQWAHDAEVNILSIGQGVVLHDSRTIETLAALVERDDVISAGCAVVRSTDAKKGWATDIHTAGVVNWVGPLEAARPLTLRDPALLPLAIYPVVQRMGDLWMARAVKIDETNECQMIPVADRAGYHVCTSLVSASLVGEPCDQQISDAGPEAATGVKVFLG